MSRHFRLMLLVIILYLPAISIAQQKVPTITEIEKFVDKIPNNNTTTAKNLASTLSAYGFRGEAGLRGCFYWMMKNMKYDLKDREKLRNIVDNHPAMVKHVLAVRATICLGYSQLFHGLAQELGFRSFVLHGNVKHGEIISEDTHAWVGVKIDTAWYLFDPTWSYRIVHDSAAGDIEYTYFKMKGEDFVTNHIPFDPMWQFQYYPITHKQFCTTWDTRGSRFFNYQDTLAVHFNRPEKEQHFSELKRILNTDSEYSNFYLIGHITALENQSGDPAARDLVEDYLKRGNPLFAAADSLFNIGYRYAQLATIYKDGIPDWDSPNPSFAKYIDSSLVFLKQAADKMDEVVIPVTAWRYYYYNVQNHFRNQYEFYLGKKNEYAKKL